MAYTTSSRRHRRRGRARAADSTSAAGESCITASVPSSGTADRDADRPPAGKGSPQFVGTGSRPHGLYLTALATPTGRRYHPKGRTMNITHTRKAVGAAIAGAAAPALLFLGAGTAQAIPDVSERGAVAIIDDLPTPRTCASCVPQPDPPGYPDPSKLPSLRGFDLPAGPSRSSDLPYRPGKQRPDISWSRVGCHRRQGPPDQ